MPDLIILRGLPGAGKTELAYLLADGKWPVYSVDDYFTDPVSGSYNFIFSENHLAYANCIANVRRSMSDKVSKIFIHNTFTAEWEMEPYFLAANEFGYRVFVLTVENRHCGKNTHGISDEQLNKMAEKFKVVLL